MSASESAIGDFSCLSLDLEVGRRDGRIHALAGVRSDTGKSLTWSGPAGTLAPPWSGWTPSPMTRTSFSATT